VNRRLTIEKVRSGKGRIIAGKTIFENDSVANGSVVENDFDILRLDIRQSAVLLAPFPLFPPVKKCQ